MENFKTKYIPESTVFDRTIPICYFKTILVIYGKLIQKGIYKIELNLPLHKLSGYFHITLYKGKTKPKFRNIVAIGCVYFPFYCILYVLILIAYLLIAIMQIIFAFYYNYLHDSDDILLKISGYISLILSIIGLITLIKYFL